MNEKICSFCHGRGSDVYIECTNCNGSGYDPTEDKPFAQCHTCYGEGIEEAELCPNCEGEGIVDEYSDIDISEVEPIDEQDDIKSTVKIGWYMKVEKLKKSELDEYCKELGINTKGVRKADLVAAVYQHQRAEIDKAIESGNCLELLKQKIGELSDEYAGNLKAKIINRHEEMQSDDNSHYLIYRVLGISNDEGALIDEYQNTGRFLYKYAGSFLEEAASLCLFFSNSSGRKTTVKNTQGQKPKTFEIDFLNGNDAVELKWRDATTDGDQITKEHTRVRVIKEHGYTPIRVMFYYPQREQAIKIQDTLKTLYSGVDGEYYAGDDAWNYLLQISGYDLKSILIEIAERRDSESLENE